MPIIKNPSTTDKGPEADSNEALLYFLRALSRLCLTALLAQAVLFSDYVHSAQFFIQNYLLH